MTQPDDTVPRDLTDDEPEVDADAAEEYAESVPIDPSPDEVTHYLEMVGDPGADPQD